MPYRRTVQRPFTLNKYTTAGNESPEENGAVDPAESVMLRVQNWEFPKFIFFSVPLFATERRPSTARKQAH
jgi:hypothetical protein